MTVIVGAIVAVHSLPSQLGLTHEARAKHRAITLAPVNLSHQSLAGFQSDAGDHDAAALPAHDRGSRPRFALAVTRDGALLAQVAATGDAVSSDAAAADAGGSGGGTGASAGQGEPAPDPNGNGGTNPNPNPTPSPTPTPTPIVPTIPTTPTDPTPTDTTPTPPGPDEPPLPSSTEAKVLSPSIPIVVPRQVTLGDVQQVAQEVQASTGLAGTSCAEDVSRCHWLAEMMVAALTDSAGRPVSVAVAAQRLERALPQMRRVETAGGPSVDGAEVDVTVHAADLKGETIFLKWQLIERGTGSLNLYGRWLSANSMYRLIPTSDDDEEDLVLWVPLPPRRGSYGIRLLAYVDGERIKHKDVPLKL